MTASSNGRAHSWLRVQRALRPVPGLISLCVALLLAGAALADATIQLPPTATGDVGDFIQVPATTAGTQVRWYSVDAALKLFPTNLLKDTKTAVVIGKVAGSYRLLAWTSDASGPSDAAVCVVTVGTPTPPPPPPPTDPLQAALQAAYSADPSPAKAGKKVALQALYGMFPQKPLSRSDLKTMADVYAACEAERLKLMADTDLATEQAVINAYLTSKFPPSQGLDQTTRAAVAAAFVQIAGALGSIN